MRAETKRSQWKIWSSRKEAKSWPGIWQWGWELWRPCQKLATDVKTTWEQGGWPGKLGRERNRELHCFFSFLLRSNAPPFPCSSYPFSTICLFGLDHQVCHHQVGTFPHPLGNYSPSSPCSRGARPLPVVGDCNEYDSYGLRNVDSKNMPTVSHYLMGVNVTWTWVCAEYWLISENSQHMRMSVRKPAWESFKG